MVRTYTRWAGVELAPYANAIRIPGHSPEIPEETELGNINGISGVADGTRTHDNRNHNPGLYQLSYSHRKRPEIWPARPDSNQRPSA